MLIGKNGTPVPGTEACERQTPASHWFGPSGIPTGRASTIMEQRKPYHAPRLRVHGSVEHLTENRQGRDDCSLRELLKRWFGIGDGSFLRFHDSATGSGI